MPYQLPDNACEYRFIHARGPGGQHVNKASTGVELRVHLNKLELPPGAMTRLRRCVADSPLRGRVSRTRGSHPAPPAANKKAPCGAIFLAEREGFEPPVPARGQRISSAPRSTTPAPLQGPGILHTGRGYCANQGRICRSPKPPGFGFVITSALKRLIENGPSRLVTPVRYDL